MNRVIKKLAFIGTLLVLATCTVYASEITAESKITAVTVYPDRALVTRSVGLEVTPQTYDIVFDHLPGVAEAISSLRLPRSPEPLLVQGRSQ